MSAHKPNRMRKRRFVVMQHDHLRPYIDDDDFHWDCLLRVSGDFETEKQRLRYMRAIAKVLSDNEHLIPFCPREGT